MPQKTLILVVDDDGPILVLMRSVLREFGFDAVTANNGQQALESVRRDRPSLVLLDRHMPGMSGDEVMRAIRAEPHEGRLPVLILSGQPLSPQELQELDADGAVLKPFDLTHLIDQIRGYVG